LGLIFYWFVILELLQITVRNSSIPLNLHNIFDLNENTLLLFIVLGFLFYSVQYSFEWYTDRILSNKGSTQLSVVVSVLLFLLFGLFRVLVYEDPLLVAIIPLLLFFTHVYFFTRTEFSQRLGFQLLNLALFTISVVISTNEYNENKDRELRKKYAALLSVERNQLIENDFALSEV
jgi:hypothetical protein